MSRARTWGLALVVLALLLPLAAARAGAIDVGAIAPDFKVYEDVAEEDLEFYAYVKDHVALLWIWDWTMGCPI